MKSRSISFYVSAVAYVCAIAVALLSMPAPAAQNVAVLTGIVR